MAAPREELGTGDDRRGDAGAGDHAGRGLGRRRPGRRSEHGKRIYVWFDAVIGYLTSAKEWASLTGRSRGVAEVVGGSRRRVVLLHRQGQHPVPHRHLAGDAHGLRRLNLPTDVPPTSTSRSRAEGLEVFGYRPLDRWYAERLEPDALRYAIAAVLPEQNDPISATTT